MNRSCRNVSKARMPNRPAASGKQAKCFQEPVVMSLVIVARNAKIAQRIATKACGMAYALPLGMIQAET